MTTPKIHSPALKQAIEAAFPKITAFKETLDSISDDIKAVEKWLQDSAVRVEVAVEYHDTGYYTTEPMAQAMLDASVTIPVQSEACTLAWAPGADGKTWRIHFRRYRRQGTWDLGVATWEETELVDSRPLIETPVAIRLSLGDALTKLVEKIAEQIPRYKGETLIEGTLYASEKESGGIAMIFVPPGSAIQNQPVRHRPDWDAVTADMKCLGAEQAPLRRPTPGSFMAEVKVPVSALRELGLLKEAAPTGTTRRTGNT